MSLLEVYETADSLRQLKRNEPLKANVVRCLVTSTIPTRPREFRPGVVFTAMGVLRIGTGGNVNAAENTIKINFYNEWAHAASFMEKDDVILLKGFIIVEAPQLPVVVTPQDRAAAHETCLVALESGSTLRVLQPGEQGDTMEVTVTPDSFEVPCVRVLPRLDHSNRVFINDAKKAKAPIRA